jgi:hypothetical protein
VAVPVWVVVFQVKLTALQPGRELKVPLPGVDDSKLTVPPGALGESDPGGAIATPAVAVTAWPETTGSEADPVTLLSPKYTACISTPEAVAAKATVQLAVPL